MVPFVDGDLVVSSLARAREALTAPPIGTPLASMPPPPVTGTPVWLPEQAAALASLADAGALARAPLPPNDGAGEGDPGFDTVLDAARDLLAHASLVTAAPDAATVERELLAVPLPMLLAFTHDARADAERFGARLTRWLAATAGASTGEADGWNAVPVPLEGSPEARPTALPPDDLGRLAVVTLVARAAAGRGRADATVARVAQAIARGWGRVTATASPAARLDLALDTGAVESWMAGAPLGPLSRALTGTLVRHGRRAGAGDPGSGLPALALRGSLAIATPRGWEDAGTFLAPSTARLIAGDRRTPHLFATALDDRRAIVTRTDLTGSAIVGESGHAEAAPSWPCPILAEGPWGDGGRAFAWTMHPPRLLVREPDGTIAVDLALPFVPSSAEAEGDAIRFTAHDGGWRWTTRDGATHAIAGPPLVAAFARADGSLELAPYAFGEPPPGRPRTNPPLAWTPAGGLHELPSSPLGAVWARASRGGWTAEALPDADLVRLSDAQGTRGWLICDGPRMLAWAGRALVVVTISGDVFHVPDVAGALS
jgi:hypothetical protein